LAWADDSESRDLDHQRSRLDCRDGIGGVVWSAERDLPGSEAEWNSRKPHVRLGQVLPRGGGGTLRKFEEIYIPVPNASTRGDAQLVRRKAATRFQSPNGAPSSEKHVSLSSRSAGFVEGKKIGRSSCAGIVIIRLPYGYVIVPLSVWGCGENEIGGRVYPTCTVRSAIT